MKINKTQNNVAFQSRFEFIDSKKFFELSKNEKAIWVDSFGEDFKKITGGGGIFTGGIGTCTAYCLTEKALKTVILGHYNKFAEEVLEFIKDFINKGRAFALGGDIIDGMDEFFKNDIKAFLNAKIKTTIFWGQTEKFSNVYYDADKDIAYIYKKFDFGDKGVDSIETLKSAYHIINVAEGDEVYINGKFVSPELINQNNEEYIAA